MEWLDVVDAEDRPLGITKLKQDIHQDGDWHRTTHIYVMNPAGELLCNLRHPDKDLFASLWDMSFGGHVSAGEAYADGARRELEEEAGIRVEPHEISYLYSIAGDGYDVVSGLIDREHTAVFLYETDRPLEAFTYQQEEISALRFVSISQLRQHLREPDGRFPLVPLGAMYAYALDRLTDYRNGLLPNSAERPRFSWRDALKTDGLPSRNAP